MTELEKLEAARRTLDQLANGINPLSGEPHPEDTLLNDVALIRKFFFAAQILEKVIDNGGIVGYVRVRDRRPFEIAAEQLSTVSVSEKPLTITNLVSSINQAAYAPDMRRLSPTQVTLWLEQAGFLQTVKNAEGKNQRIPTENAASIGIELVERKNSNGSPFQMNLYSSDAQRFVLDNMSAILAIPA